MGSTSTSTAALRERGFVLLEALVSSHAVRALRAAITELVEEIAPASLYSRDAIPLDGGHAITPTGLAIPRLLTLRPELASLVLTPDLLGFVGAALGEGARVELVGAVVSDRTRPFFEWHTHIDGLDEGARVRNGVWPKVPDVRRLLTLLYLDDVDDRAGPLLVLPRHAGDPTEPIAPLGDRGWPGQVVLRPRAGALVALDQCTWHAVEPMAREGARVFVGAYFAAAHASPAPWADPDLQRVRVV